MRNYQNFLVPYDFSEHAEAALSTARDLVPRFDANIHLVNVLQPPAYAYGFIGYGGAVDPVIDLAELHAAATRALDAVCERLKDLPGEHAAHVVEGSLIADTICEAAKRLDSGLIIMGTHGRTGLSHAVLGSVAERTIRFAPCPVVTVNEKAAEADGASPS